MKERPLGIPNYFLSYKEKKLNYFHVKCIFYHIVSTKVANLKLILCITTIYQ